MLAMSKNKVSKLAHTQEGIRNQHALSGKLLTRALKIKLNENPIYGVCVCVLSFSSSHSLAGLFRKSITRDYNFISHSRRVRLRHTAQHKGRCVHNCLFIKGNFLSLSDMIGNLVCLRLYDFTSSAADDMTVRESR
jgi:hypothetical protein